MNALCSLFRKHLRHQRTGLPADRPDPPYCGRTRYARPDHPPCGPRRRPEPGNGTDVALRGPPCASKSWRFRERDLCFPVTRDVGSFHGELRCEHPRMGQPSGVPRLNPAAQAAGVWPPRPQQTLWPCSLT